MLARLALLACLLATSLPAATSGLPELTVELAGRQFVVEVADTDASRTRGLMFRESLPSDRGMLFVFDHEAPLAFWMKNTRIPLDILYFDSNRRLVSVAADTPPCVTAYCPSYESERPARYVLELNAGIAGELGVKVGEVLRIAP
jgi:uncharacterized protein